MGLAAWACHSYQRLFRVNYPEAEQLARLHVGPESDHYLQAYFDHEYRKGAAILARFHAVCPDWERGKGLDFGCGGGGITYRLREYCEQVTGIDLETPKIEFARLQGGKGDQAGGVEFLQYGGGAVPLPDASFDVILCVDVIEHLPEPERFVAEFLRLLRPGGWLLLSFGPPWYHPHGKHMWVKLPGWWTHLLFPRSAVMSTAGFPATHRWADIGLHRLSVGHFETIMRASGFQTRHQEVYIKKILSPLKSVPGVRELFISEVVGIYQKPSAVAGQETEVQTHPAAGQRGT